MASRFEGRRGSRTIMMGRIHMGNTSLGSLLAALLAAGSSAMAADVTPQRLASPEPGNWLTNHRTYDAQRFAPLAQINKTNVRNLKLAYAVAIGGSAPGENLQATPLVDDGYIYVVDAWGVVYKIDGRDGQTGRIVWRMDPGQEKMAQSNRGAALWGNLVISHANFPARVVATNRDTGKLVWETNVQDQPDLLLTSAPLPIRDRIVVGAAGGDKGVRDWIASFDATHARPARACAGCCHVAGCHLVLQPVFVIERPRGHHHDRPAGR